LPETKRQSGALARNGSGVRDTARVVGSETGTVRNELKKQGSALQPGNAPGLAASNAPATTVLLQKVEEAELEERGSVVGSKKESRWLWQALDPQPGQVVAYGCGQRKEEVFRDLQALVAPFGIARYFTEGWGAYLRHLAPGQHEMGKRHTQKLDRKPLTLRTRLKRLVRKTICFSRSPERPDIVIGLFINRFACGMAR